MSGPPTGYEVTPPSPTFAKQRRRQQLLQHRSLLQGERKDLEDVAQELALDKSILPRPGDGDLDATTLDRIETCLLDIE